MSSQADQQISGSAGQRRQKWCGCRWFGAKRCKAKLKNIIRCARPRTPQRRTSWGLSAWRTLTVSPLTSRLSFNLFPWGLCWSPNILDGSSTWRCVHPCWRLHPMRIHAGGTKLKSMLFYKRQRGWTAFIGFTFVTCNTVAAVVETILTTPPSTAVFQLPECKQFNRLSVRCALCNICVGFFPPAQIVHLSQPDAKKNMLSQHKVKFNI